MHTNATHLPNKQNPFYLQSVSCFFIPPSKHFSQVRPLLTHIHFPHIQAHSEIIISVTSAQNKFSSKAPKTTVTIPPSRAFICCQNGIFFPHENQSISPKRPLLPSRRQQPPQALLSPASCRARCSPVSPCTSAQLQPCHRTARSSGTEPTSPAGSHLYRHDAGFIFLMAESHPRCSYMFS